MAEGVRGIGFAAHVALGKEKGGFLPQDRSEVERLDPKPLGWR
jgi:hypothetical protein